MHSIENPLIITSTSSRYLGVMVVMIVKILGIGKGGTKKGGWEKEWVVG
jgi:hypothetical protein